MTGKKLSRRQIKSRIRKALGPIRGIIERKNPRPKDYPCCLGWNIAFDVDKDGVALTVWSALPFMVRQVPVSRRLLDSPWTEAGAEMLETVCDVIRAECETPCRVTFVMGLWENTFGKDGG